MAYLLDANVFIQGRKLHFGFDICPGFWDWLERERATGRVRSIERVGTELSVGTDELATWASSRGDDFFLPADSGAVNIAHVSAVRIDEAAALIAPAVRETDHTWADLGAGTGTFTGALASLLPAGARIIAVERDAAGIAELRAVSSQDHSGVIIEAVHADFTKELDLPPVDGALLANSLHYVPYDEQRRVLRLVMRCVRPGGRLAIVEYERRAANPWVPYPLSFRRLKELADAVGLGAFERLGARASHYGGAMYAAMGVIGEREDAGSAGRSSERR